MAAEPEGDLGGEEAQGALGDRVGVSACGSGEAQFVSDLKF